MSFLNPIPGLNREVLPCLLGIRNVLSHHFALGGIPPVGRPPMVELMNHLRLVEGEVVNGEWRMGSCEWRMVNGGWRMVNGGHFRAFAIGHSPFALVHRRFALHVHGVEEQAAVVRHVEHRRKRDAPGILFRLVVPGLGDEHGTRR